jgi:hypothetical protein
MLAEIDKDARDIAALQKENENLKTELQQLQRKVEYLIELEKKRDVPIIFDAETMLEVPLEPFDEIQGRKLFLAPFVKGKTYVAGSSLQIIKVYGYDSSIADASDVCLPLYNNSYSSEGRQPSRKVNFDGGIKIYFKKKYASLSIGVHRDTSTRGMILNYAVDFYPIERKKESYIYCFSLFLIEKI